MPAIVRRMLVLLLIPLGLMLVAAPLDTDKSVWMNTDTVFLRIHVAKHVPEASEARVVTREELEPYPNLGLELRISSYGPPVPIVSGGERKDEFPYEAIPMDEWRAFVSDVLDGDTRFVLVNNYFEARVEKMDRFARVEVKGLDTGRRIAGALMLFAGIFLLVGLYPQTANEGIRIASRKTAIMGDVLMLCLGLPFMWFFAQDAIGRLFLGYEGTSTEIMIFMSYFWGIFIIPLLSLFLTATAQQVLIVTANNVRLKGMGGGTLNWDEIENFEVVDFRAPRSVGGMAMSRKVLQQFKIIGTAGTLAMMEPPWKATKQDIVEELLRCAPARLQEKIRECGQAW